MSEAERVPDPGPVPDPAAAQGAVQGAGPTADPTAEATVERAPDPAADPAAQDPAAQEPAGRTGLIRVVLAVALVVIAIDQITKAMAEAWLRPRIESGQGPIPIIGEWFQLSYVQNTGAAFGIGTGLTWIFTIIACVVVVVILRTARRIGSVWWAVALGGLLGGATGNLIDRLTREPGLGQGYVVDFLALPNFPVFNVADMAVVGSAGLMVLLSFLGVEYTTGRRR